MPRVQFFSGPAGLKTPENPRFRPTHPPPSPKKKRYKDPPTHPLARGRQLQLAVGADPPAAGAAQRDLLHQGPVFGCKIAHFRLCTRHAWDVLDIPPFVCQQAANEPTCQQQARPRLRRGPGPVAPCSKTREQDPPTHPPRAEKPAIRTHPPTPSRAKHVF